MAPPTTLEEAYRQLQAAPRTPIPATAGMRVLGLPFARGNPTLADIAIGVVASLPHENLNECIVCRVLWRDPINATPLEIRQFSCSMFYADRFLCMDGRGEGASEGEGVDGAPTPPLPPFPYQAGDFELLEGNDRAACEAAGFTWQIHVIPTYIGSGRGEKRRRPA